MKARIAKKIYKRTDPFDERNQEAVATLRRLEHKALMKDHIDWHTMQFNEVYVIGFTEWNTELGKEATRYYVGEEWNRTMESDWPAWDLDYDRIDHAYPFFKKSSAEHDVKNFAPFWGCNVYSFVPAEVFKTNEYGTKQPLQR